MSSQLAPDLFRRACALWATGIAVITLSDPSGTAHGMTANSFTSVSLNPPLILFCIDHRAALLPHIAVARPVTVNVLEEDQADLSSRFARKGEDRFENLDWALGSLGSPVLAGTLATFECTVTESISGGDHQIVIARVISVRSRPGRPLLYFESGYETLGT